MASNLTPAQIRALAELRRAGELTRVTAHHAGVQAATLDKLVRAGVATVEHVPVGRGYTVWRPA